MTILFESGGTFIPLDRKKWLSEHFRGSLFDGLSKKIDFSGSS